MLEQQMIGRVRINYLPGCISPDEVEAALASISPAEANVFAHEALEGCSLTLIWTNRAAASERANQRPRPDLLWLA